MKTFHRLKSLLVGKPEQIYFKKFIEIFQRFIAEKVFSETIKFSPSGSVHQLI